MLGVSIWAAIAVAFVLPYNFAPWWKFMASTVFILGALRFHLGDDWLLKCGLSLGRVAWVQSILLTIAVYLLTQPLISWAAASAGLRLETSVYPRVWILLPIFQVLMEEVLLRAVLLNYLIKRWSNQAAVSILASLFFVGIHTAFYPLTQGGWLDLSSNLTLFFLGITLNSLYFRFGHIGFAYALHAGWNLNQYGRGHFVNAVTGDRVVEAVSFNALVGSWPILAIALTLSIITFFIKIDIKSQKNYYPIP